MSKISIISKTSHQVLQTVDTDSVKEITLTENSAVVIDIPKDDVARISREGNSAVITLRNGEKIVIHNYFNDDNSADNSLAFVDDNGQMFWAEFTDANGAVTDTIKYHLIDDVEPLLYNNDSFAGLLLPWLAGAAAVGAIAAAASHSSDGGGSSGGGGIIIDEGDKTPPATPDIDPVNPRDPITGTGEPGSEITVTFPDGTTATTEVDANGEWTVPNPGNLQDGDEIKAIAEDDAGNKSDEATEIVDGKGPEKPTIDDVEEGDAVITGTADYPDAVTVTVTFPDGSTAIAQVAEDGTWSVPNPGLKDGDEIKAVATDAAKNDSEPATLVVNFSIDPPTLDTIYDDVANASAYGAKDQNLLEGDKFKTEFNGVSTYHTNDQKPTFGGSGEPGAVVTVYRNVAGDEVALGSTTVGADGRWSYTAESDLSSRAHKIFAKQQDATGHVSNPSETIDISVNPNPVYQFNSDSSSFGLDEATFAIGTGPDFVPLTVVLDSVKIYGKDGVTDPSSSIHVLDKDGKVVEGVTWSFNDASNPHIVTMKLPANFIGPYTVSVPAQSFHDYAGNYNNAYSYTNTPLAPLHLTSDVQGNELSIYNGDITNDATPVIPLNIPKDASKVLIRDATGKITTVELDGNTDKNFQFDQPFSEGTHSLSFSYIYSDEPNAKDNQSPWSEPFEFTVDTKAFISTPVSDTFATGAEFDSVIFNLLDDNSATGGNTDVNSGIIGADRWTDFELNADPSATAKDAIDVSRLLSDDVNDGNVQDYLKVSTITNDEGRVDTVISIDRDAAGSKYNPTELLILQNVNTTLDDLLANKQLLF